MDIWSASAECREGLWRSANKSSTHCHDRRSQRSQTGAHIMSHSTFIGLLGLMTMIEQQTAALNGLYPMHSVTSFGQETDQPNSDGGDAESYPSWEYHQSAL